MDRSVRLSVATIWRPPGFTRTPAAAMKAATSETCSTTSRLSTTSNALAGFGQRLHRAVPIVDFKTRLPGVGPRDLDGLGPGVDSGNRGAEPRHRLADQAATAAEIDDAQPVERPRAGRVDAEIPANRIADHAQPRRVHAVQRRKLAPRIPPFSGHGGEAGDLCGIDRRAGGSGLRRRSAAAILRCVGHAAPVAPIPDASICMARPPGGKPPAANGRPPPVPSASFREFRWRASFRNSAAASVGDLERIRHVAARVQREVEAGNEVAVVLSAMAGATDQLVAWAREASAEADRCEYDVVVSAGEQVTIGLLAIVLQDMGIAARSLDQLAIADPHRRRPYQGAHPDHRYRRARSGLRGGYVAIVPGFQGISPDGRITTMGRGGSDTTAVALAAALNADRCDIFTDVDGVYTCDPRIVAKARSWSGSPTRKCWRARRRAPRCCRPGPSRWGMKHHVRIQVRSSFEDVSGTLVVDEDEIVEQEIISGIAYSRDEAKITVARVADKPGVAAAIFGPLADATINVDMIVQNVSEDGEETDITFTVPEGDHQRAIDAIMRSRDAIGYARLDHDANVSRCRSSASACAATPAWPSGCSRPWPKRVSTSR